MKIRLLNMGFTLQNGVYVKANTNITVTITGNTLLVKIDDEEFPDSSISDLEYLLLERYGDEL